MADDYLSFILIGISLIIMILLLHFQSKIFKGEVTLFKGSKWGFNSAQVICPNCSSKQPKMRKPLNRRERLWGGYTCDKCGTAMDKWGARIGP